MLRHAILCLALIPVAGCKDWTRVPPPPVALSALEGSATPNRDDFPVTPTASRVRLLRAVAPGALATLHFPDIAGAQQRFKGTTLYKLMESPELRRLFAEAGVDVEQIGRMNAASAQAPGGMNFGQVQKALQGELVVSLGDIELKEGQPFPMVKALAGVSVTGAEHEVQQLLDLAVMALGNNPNARVEQGSLKGTPYTRFRFAGPPELIVEAALYRDALLVGVGREVVTEAIARLDDETIEALPDDASFGRCMQRVSDAHDVVRLHVDLAGFYARVRDHVPAAVEPALALIGFEHMKAVAAAISIEGKDLVTKTFLDSPGGKDFFTDLLRRHSADRGLLEQIPDGATSFSLFTVDGRVVLDRLREKLGEEGRKDLEDGLATLKSAGCDLERDILDTFGPRYALVTVRAGRRDATGLDVLWNQLMGTALVIETKDGEAVDRQLAKLPKSDAEMVRTDETVGGTPVISYRFPRERLPRGLAIEVAKVEGHLLVTLSRETTERMLQPPSAETVEHFREMIREVPETAVALSYDDLSQSNGFLTIAIAEGLRKAQRETGAGDGELPALPSLGEHGANPAVSYTLADEFGIFTRTRAPTGGLTEISGLSGTVAAAGVLMPALATERMRANETDALRAMESIRGALSEYHGALTRDVDGDGEGEYAFLAELLGDEHARGGPKPGRALLSEFERTPLGYRKHGYYFRVYLPAEDGSPVGEHEPMARRSQVDGDLAENILVVVAWPVRAGLTGNRVFMMDGRNKIFYRDGGYGGDEAPRADNFSTQEGNLAAKSIDQHERARDGFRWSELR